MNLPLRFTESSFEEKLETVRRVRTARTTRPTKKIRTPNFDGSDLRSTPRKKRKPNLNTPEGRAQHMDALRKKLDALNV